MLGLSVLESPNYDRAVHVDAHLVCAEWIRTLRVSRPISFAHVSLKSGRALSVFR